MGRFRMQKCDELISSAREGRFVDQANTVGRGVGQLILYFVGSESDVMDAFAVLFQKLCDRAFR